MEKLKLTIILMNLESQGNNEESISVGELDLEYVNHLKNREILKFIHPR